MSLPDVYANIVRSKGGSSTLLGPCAPMLSQSGVTQTGSMMQCGVIASGATGVATVAFPFAFPTAIDCVQVSLVSTALGPYIVGVVSGSGSAAGFQLYACTTAGVGVNTFVYWTVVGH